MTAGGVALGDDEYELRLLPSDPERSAPLPGNAGVVVLDTEVKPEFEAEGLARDVVRVIQQARRKAGLHISQRVVVTVDGSDAVTAAVRAHEAFVAGEVLADALRYGSDHVSDGTVGSDEAVRVGVAPA